MYDVRFLGGHGTSDPSPPPPSAQSLVSIYNNTHTADADINRRWDGQYPSLWVTGGGTFVGLWTPSTFAQAGLYVSNTSTPGRVYELSSEHHVRNEVVLDHVSNWQLYALQTEEERGESGFCLPLDIRNSSNITLANLLCIASSAAISRFRTRLRFGLARHSLPQRPRLQRRKVSFDNSVYDYPRFRASPARVLLAHRFRRRAAASAALRTHRSSWRRAAKVEKLTTGFFNVSGGAVDPPAISSSSMRENRPFTSGTSARRHFRSFATTPLTL